MKVQKKQLPWGEGKIPERMENMEHNEVDVWGVFGLEEPAEQEVQQPPEGEQEPETAEPADAGEQDQELAEPDAEEDDLDEDKPNPEAEPEKKPLTREQRRENAKRRREQEIRERVEAALAEERKAQKARLDAFFGQAKMKNQHKGGAEIRSLEDAEEWAQSDRMARVQANLKSGKLTPEDITALVEESPAVKALQENQSRQAQAAQEQDQQRFRVTVEQEMAEIRAMNPRINSLTDILAMETGKEFARLVQHHGLSYLEAYKLANQNQLMEQARNVAATGARVAAGGKEHLTKTQTRGQTPVEVPKDIAEGYRVMNPGITDADIEKKYRKWLKG